MGSKPTTHIDSLDALRGLAALAVVAFHVYWLNGLQLPLLLRSTLAAEFGLGVQMFFILSAFCLCLRYAGQLRTREDVQSYYLRRFFRIAPLYYVMMAAWLLVYVYYLDKPQTLAMVILNAAFVINFDPGNGIVWAGWTLGVEMAFYVIFPIMVLAMRDMKTAFAGTLAALVLSVAYCSVFPSINGKPNDGWLTFPPQIVFFAAGILAFRIYETLREAAWRRGISHAFLAASFAIWFSIWLFGLSDLRVGQVNVTRYLICSAFFPLIISQALHRNIVLSNPVTVYLGVRGYSLYLLHPMIILFMVPVVREYIYTPDQLASGSVTPFVASVAVIYALVIAAAIVTYRLVEAPGSAAGKMLDRLWRPSPTTVSA